jgi:hypothetical protein
LTEHLAQLTVVVDLSDFGLYVKKYKSQITNHKSRINHRKQKWQEMAQSAAHAN